MITNQNSSDDLELLRLVFGTEQSKMIDQNLISGTDPLVVSCTDSGIVL